MPKVLEFPEKTQFNCACCYEYFDMGKAKEYPSKLEFPLLLCPSCYAKAKDDANNA